MRGIFRHGALLLVSLLTAACADDGGPAGCVMREVADLPVLNDRGVPIVRAAVNGVPVAFIVDTGARASTIGERDADALQLPIDFDHRYLVTGIGGSTFAGEARINRLSLGHSVARNIAFMAVGRYGGTVGGLQVVGLFGADFLSNYDVEFDLPAHRIALYTERHCGDHIRPWSGPLFEQPFHLVNETEIRFGIVVNDAPIDVQLDSGAGASVLDSDAAAAAGATKSVLASDRRTLSRGVDGRPVVGFLHRFDRVLVGPERLGPVLMNVADTGGHTLLGADFLRGHAVWISYPHEMIYAARRSVGPPAEAPPVAAAPASRP